MNKPIIRLFGLVVVLFALLVGFTSRWTIFEAASLRENGLNARSLLQQERLPRGPIVAADGTVLAASHRQGEGIYERSYPTRELFAHPLGYYDITRGVTGLERFRNEALEGTRSHGLQAILDQLQGRKPVGEKVVTTLDPRAQRVAEQALSGQRGAVVALDPRNGNVTVMASSPSYDPNLVKSPKAFEALERDPKAQPLINRATQFGYAPGSTFKVVTATAALDTGLFTPESTISGRNGIAISGVPLGNDNGETFGQITLTQALVKSVNTVWAQVAEKVGRPTLARYMARFGFDRKPRLDYPAAEMSTSGEIENGRIVPPTSERVDLGRLGIGQDKLAVVPLQMAEVAGAVANHGTLMVPHLTARIVNAEGQTTETVGPRVQSVVMKPSTATAVTGMMEAVVKEGTGTSAQIPGVPVAGKTGTAETLKGTTINNVWFIAFAPANAPRVALAVTLQGVPGQGASFAAPVARQVMEQLLRD
ncbi:MAG: peptidoglycan D,D-transpeptidase FtsI family protein [Solirubrobacteraceae bacterium]